MGSSLFMGFIGFASSGIGLVLGGFLALVFYRLKRSVVPVIFSLCSGMIIGLVILEIIPESIKIGGMLSTLIGISLGFYLFSYIHKLSHILSLNTGNRLVQAGIVMAAAIGLHNIPTGIALGASMNHGFTFSMVMMMTLHTIPEGIAIFTPLFLARFEANVIFPITMLVSLPVAIGALIGAIAGITSTWLLSIIIGASMSIVLAVTTRKILGEAIRKMPIFFCLFFTLVGFYLILVFI